MKVQKGSKQPVASTAQSQGCQVCNAETASVHFSASVCLACAAFFRRTVQLSLEKTYICSSNNFCDVSQYARNVCRRCRLKKCLQIGMDPTGVQPKRHPIRKKRTESEVQSSAEITDISNTEEVEPKRNEPLTADYFAPVSRKDKSILTEITNAYRLLEKSRAEKYSSIDIPYVIDSKTGRKMACELDHAIVVKEIEMHLTGFFANSIEQFADIPSSQDKFALFKQFAVIFESLDMCYQNLCPNWIETGIIRTTDGLWVDLKEIAKIYATGTKTKCHDPAECEKMFKPTMEQIKHEMAQPMFDLNINEKEMMALLGLTLFDTSNKKISTETRARCQDICNRLFRELMDYCNEQLGPEDGPARFGSIILLLTAGKRLVLASQELYQMIKIFNMMDGLFLDVYNC